MLARRQSGKLRRVLLTCLGAFGPAAFAWAGGELGRGRVYSVVELSFVGPVQKAIDTPARDIAFSAIFRHESGSPEVKVQGFWDGDGKGGASGNVFKIRFCPTQPGRWTLADVHSSAKELAGQKQGDYVTAETAALHGFWLPDAASPGARWYRRSDGSHQYIVGNTHYSFLSGYMADGQPTGNDIVEDIAGNARFFKKLRMGIGGDRYPHPVDKPFLDDAGQPTDAGDYSHRPNPQWFSQRVDVAVARAFDVDLIADLILAGPDIEQSRSTLRAANNHGDATPLLRYMAARYGCYPNVWFCLCNERDIKKPSYTEKEIARWGAILRSFLPYPTPISVHESTRRPWSALFDDLPPWNDHQIIQKKLKQLARAADVMQDARKNPATGHERDKPTIDDELSYQGAGDKHTAEDTVEAHLGAFLGGGYGSTGEKRGSKLGQYFWGKFDPQEHSAAKNLKYLRETIDANITFWQMAPDAAIFPNLDPQFRAMSWPGNEYVLGTDKAVRGMVANLPPGTWQVTQFEIIARRATTISSEARGAFRFDSPASRAVLFHFKRSKGSNAPP